jgi:hypothetical protein
MEMEASHGGEGEGMKARASMGHVGGASGARRGRVRSRRGASGRVWSRWVASGRVGRVPSARMLHFHGGSCREAVVSTELFKQASL